MNIFLFFQRGKRPVRSYGFTWEDGLVDDEETAQSEYNLRHVAYALGLYFHKEDYIRDENSSERTSRLEKGKKYFYVSHH